MGGLDDDACFDPLIEFPGEISMVRAYIFALTAGIANTRKFNVDNFIAGVARFGVENPTPCVSARI